MYHCYYACKFKLLALFVLKDVVFMNIIKNKLCWQVAGCTSAICAVTRITTNPKWLDMRLFILVKDHINVQSARSSLVKLTACDHTRSLTQTWVQNSSVICARQYFSADRTWTFILKLIKTDKLRFNAQFAWDILQIGSIYATILVHRKLKSYLTLWIVHIDLLYLINAYRYEIVFGDFMLSIMACNRKTWKID